MREKPLAIDLYCGLGGFTEGLLATGYYCVGFDIEQHVYGEHHYPGQLVIQDVLTLHGSQFRKAALIVASPPCQFFSYCAMPWTRAKQLARDVRADPVRLEKELALFRACFRIQREACEAAGHHVPMVVENVRGAIPWVGRSRWNFGSFHLWGDVPALMPVTLGRSVMKAGVAHRPDGVTNFHGAKIPNQGGGVKNGGDWFGSGPDCSLQRRFSGTKQSGISGTRENGKGDRWFQDGAAQHSSKSSARKAASAMIAKIPLPLSRHIGATYYPREQVRAA